MPSGIRRPPPGSGVPGTTFAPDSGDDNPNAFTTLLESIRLSLRKREGGLSAPLTRAELDAWLGLLQEREDQICRELICARLVAPSAPTLLKGEGESLDDLTEPASEAEAELSNLLTAFIETKVRILRLLDTAY